MWNKPHRKNVRSVVKREKTTLLAGFQIKLNSRVVLFKSIDLNHDFIDLFQPHIHDLFYFLTYLNCVQVYIVKDKLSC